MIGLLLGSECPFCLFSLYILGTGHFSTYYSYHQLPVGQDVTGLVPTSSNIVMEKINITGKKKVMIVEIFMNIVVTLIHLLFLGLLTFSSLS